MAKLLKITGRSISTLIEWVFILLIVFAFAIRTSYVQTYLAKETAKYLSKELEAEVSVDQVAIVFIDKVAVDGLLIRDQQGDTLIYTKRVLATLDEISLKKQRYTIGSADINGAFVHVQRSVDSIFNHAFLRDYLQRGPKKENKVKFRVKRASLRNSRFRYDDNTKKPKSKGMDYFHLSVTDINCAVSNIRVIKDAITAKVDWFNANEKSGFDVKDLTTEANVSPKGVLLSNVEIKANDSHIKSRKFDMLSNSYDCFNYFEDSVSFDAQIDESDLSLKDVAFFATELDGMNDHVRVKSKLEKKVVDLRLRDLDLRYANKTRIKGTINLDDYRDFQSGFYDEKLEYAYIDLNEIKSLRLPNSASTNYIDISPKLMSLKFIEASDISLLGFYSEFVFETSRLNTALGSAQLDNGILFSQNKENNSYFFRRSESSNYDVKVNHFSIGGYTGNPDLGIIDGTLFLAGEIFSASDIRFTEIEGKFDRFDYNDYSFEHITIQDGSYKNDVFNGFVAVCDRNLEIAFNGYIDFKGDQEMNFRLEIGKAALDKIGLSDRESNLISIINVDLNGNNMNNFAGDVNIDELIYFEGDNDIAIDYLDLSIKRSPTGDFFNIKSDAGNAWLKGKVNFNHLLQNFNYQISRVFPALYRKYPAKPKNHEHDNFQYFTHIADPNQFLDIFYPDLQLAQESEVHGTYSGDSAIFRLNASTELMNYMALDFHDVSLSNTLDSNSIDATYNIDRIAYNDSLEFHDVGFKTYGGKDKLYHYLVWEHSTETPSDISWETDVYNEDHFRFVLDPSHFYLNKNKWDIAHQSTINIAGDTISVDKLELSRNEQNILVNGSISKEEKHQLSFIVTDFDLGEVSNFITTDYPMTGIINLKGFVATPFTNLIYEGNGNLTEFVVNNRSVGDIGVETCWDRENKSIHAEGELYYIDEETFSFAGDYYVYEKENSLDFLLTFDYTDIQFTNAFMDPDVLSEIRGLLKGDIKLNGTPTTPILDGEVYLNAGSAYVDLLGVHFGIDGPIEVDKYGFYINGIPVYDQDANEGMLIGAVFHDNFDDFNFDLQFDLEPEEPVYATTVFGVPDFDKFLVMDLPYSHDVLYYGKAYVTGYANIFGYTDNLEITVDFTSVKGTTVNIPMYGVGEIEEESFITFVSKEVDTLEISTEPLFDVTGVDMDLNFHVTKDADINIIFNEEIGDVIHAQGTGDIGITLDNLGDVKMEGVFTVGNGTYDFAMRPVKQQFTIEEGGTISWTGDPYTADLNLKTFYKLNANLADISNDQLGSGSSAHQQILAYLNLTGSMDSPEIEFDFEAPQADDIGRTLLNRIKSDPDELSRQFFSLMIIRKFQPIGNLTGGNGSAVMDLVTNQINYMLSTVSSEYRMKFDYDNDQLSGDNIYEFGISKGFLNDRLILSGSFGVESYGEDEIDEQGNVHSSQWIGDINLEYLLNSSGTFRINIFNESTDKTVIQEGELGDFTQGAGLLYKEDFEDFQHFKLVQYVFDIFRSNDNKRFPNKRKRQQRAVPENSATESKP